jgi:hypothetical protein
MTLPTADDTWSAFALELTRRYGTGTRPLPNESLDLLAQAVQAHKGGAYSATAIVCRAALEAAGIQALYLERVGPASWSPPRIPLQPNGRPIRLNLDAVIDGLKLYGILDKKEADSARKVKDAGDTAAHTVERSQRMFAEYLDDLRAALAAGGKIVDVQPPATKVSEDQSLTLLQTTARTLLAIYSGTPKRTGPTPYLHYPEPSGAD